MPPTVVHPPRWKLLLMVLTCAFFVVMCAVPAGSDNSVLMVLGVAGMAAVGIAGGAVLWLTVRPGPTVRIDAEGITDRTGVVPNGLVRWEEIAAIRKREIGRGRGAERVLDVVLVRPEEFRARRRGPLRHVVDRYRTLMGHPYVSIPGSAVSVPLDTLIEQMRRWRPELTVLELPPSLPGLFRRRSRPEDRHRPPRW
jgi:hypothetical protein